MLNHRRPANSRRLLRASKRRRRLSHLLRVEGDRGLHVESLEKRELLAGDFELISISPNFGAFITDGTVLSERPRELTFKFTPGETLNASTLGAIEIVGSGFDGNFSDGNEVVLTPGFIGLGDAPDQVILRFGQSLPDDLYQITIDGSSSTPLENDNGDAFNRGADLRLEFDLDLGATVKAVVPQPVVRDQLITIADAAGLSDGDTITIDDGAGGVVFEIDQTDVAPGTGASVPVAILSTDDATTVASALALAITNATFSGPGVTATATGSGVVVSGNAMDPDVQVNAVNAGVVDVEAAGISQLRDTVLIYFNNDQLSQTVAEDVKFYRLVDTAGTLGQGDDTITLPESVRYDSANNRAILKFASAIPMGTFRLRVGTSDESNGATSNAVTVGTVFSALSYSETGFVGDEDGDNDVDLYAIELDAGANLTVTVDPDTNLDAVVRIFDSAGNELATPGVVNAGGVDALETFTVVAPSTGTFYIGVSSAGNESYTAVDGLGNSGGATSGSYRIDLDVSTTVSGSDDNSSFATATDLGLLGESQQSLVRQIQPQSIPVPLYPGGSDEPGHREIPAESHGAGAGAFNTVPSGLRTVTYYFPNQYGVNPQGLPLFNEITPNQRERAREIFEIYASQYGFEVRETAGSGIPIITGDIRAFQPTYPVGVSLSTVLISGAGNYGSSPYGGGWAGIARHEIGHAVGLGHSYDVPSNQGGSGAAEDQYPGNNDIVHGKRINRPDATDIDLYRFDVPEAGTIQAEIVAERLSSSSLLDSALRLYRQEADGSRTLVAQNDDYFSDDAFIRFDVDAAGTYFLGVSSTGNVDYDPASPDTGFGGLTDGRYQLKISHRGAASSSIVDLTDKRFDGDADGREGGTFEFDFRSDNTFFVDKTVVANLTQAVTSGQTAVKVSDVSVFPAAPFDILIDNETMTVTAVDANANTLTVTRGTPTAAHSQGTVVRPAAADGSEATPFGRIQDAVSASSAGDIIRIVANGGADNDVSTIGDNRPYVLGLSDSFAPLEDGSKLEVPKNVVLQIDAGAIIKLQKANINAGSTSQGVDLSGSAIQVLGTPENNAIFTSFGNDLIGGDSDGVTDGAQAGDWGGIAFRADSDFIAADATTNQDDLPITLNYVNQASISFGGGLVSVGGAEIAHTPIHIVDTRPTVSYNTIRNSAQGAISADPDSFSDARGRIGPDIVGNLLEDNTVNGLVIRFDGNSTGATASLLTKTARFDDTDIVHVFTDNLEIAGNAGGPINPANPSQVLPSGRLAIDPGVVVKLSSARIEGRRGASNLIAEGTPENPVIFTSLLDDRYGTGGTFDTTGNGSTSVAAPGDWSGLIFNMVSTGSIDNALIAYAGGESTIAGGPSRFNTIEAQDGAKLRVANSTFEFNASGNASDNRDARGTNTAATIFIRQVQPIIVNNIFTDNAGSLIDINANAMLADVQRDRGRSTGPLDVGVRDDRPTLQPGIDFADNRGPLVRLNRFERNDFNAMTVRGGQLSTESIWDDTDIVHILRAEIIVDQHHTFSGLRLQSNPGESLVIKLQGDNAGFSADGVRLDIDDRIGGTVQVVGRPGFPVVMTSVNDSTVGAGLTPAGFPQLVTRTAAAGLTGNPGDWRGLVFREQSNDRNVRVELEAESANNSGVELNDNPGNAQILGELAKDLKSGDDNRALGFEVLGFISADDPGDVDVYSFSVDAGTEVWIDIDRTRGASLDPMVELIQQDGTVLATSTGANDIGDLSGLALPLQKNAYDGGDFYTLNYQDAGMRVTLPGNVGGTNETYYVRVSSEGGLTDGEYQLQVRLRQTDEKPGSTVRNADIRFATNGIQVFGLPKHSPLLGESAEFGNSSTPGSAQRLGNQLESDRNTLSVAGRISAANDIDFFRFTSDYATTIYGASIQAIGAVNGGPKTWATVFDLDYADGLTRSDTNMVVFQEIPAGSGQLFPILIGRESNIADDQPGAGQGIDLDDLTRGSAGQLDPFIGPVQLPTGTPGSTTNYFVGVFSNTQLLQQLNQTFVAGADNPLVRLEPVNSLTRIAEDHIGSQGYDSNGSPIDPRFSLFDISSTTSLEPFVRTFDLNDVSLFVSRPNRLETYNALQGGLVTDLGALSGLTNFQTQDIVMRSDGTLWGYQRVNRPINNNNADNAIAGRLVQLDPGNGAVTVIGNDNVLGSTPTPAVNNPNNTNPNFSEITFTDDVDALAWERSGGVENDAQYALYYSVREEGRVSASGALLPNSKLYRANPTSGSVARNRTNQTGVRGDIQPAGVAYASGTLTVSDGNGPSTTIRIESRVAGTVGNVIRVNVTRSDNPTRVTSVTTVTGVLVTTITVNVDDTPNGTAQQIVDAINVHPTARTLVTAAVTSGATGEAAVSVTGTVTLTGGSDGVSGPLQGNVTGLSFGQFLGDASLTNNGAALYGVTDAGEFLTISTFNGVVSRVVDLTSFGITGFQGLSLGPQNLHNGVFQTTVFAVTNSGGLMAIDTATGLPVNAFGSDNETQSITISGNPVAGDSFTLTVYDEYYGSVTSGAVTFSAGGTISASDVRNALLSLTAPSGIRLFRASDLNVTGGALPGSSIQIEFQGFYQDKPVNPIVIDNAGMTGGTGSAAATTLAEGSDGVRDSVLLDLGASGATGLAFSNLDFNLWHPTTERGAGIDADAGHGINPSFDFSRTPSGADVSLTDPQGHAYTLNEQQGGVSFYFGLEQYVHDDEQEYLNYEADQTQLGIKFNDFQHDLTSGPIGGNYNLPGGGYGSLLTAPFDLTSETSDAVSVGDRPTLYFNYFLDSEDQNTTTADGEARDTARVFLSNDGGRSWQLLATNNTPFAATGSSGAQDQQTEVSDFVSHLRSADLSDSDQRVQPLFDSSGSWRQARVDLADFVGQSGLQLRFDFSTAGTIVDPTSITTTAGYGDLTDERRGQDNAFEGFYVDDIIIGWAERGEVITGATTNASFFNVPSDPDPLAPLQSLVGPYQLEIRRGNEFGAVVDPINPGIAISGTFDPNTRFIPGANLGIPTSSDDFEAGDFSSLGWRPSDADSPWTVEDNFSAFGTPRSFEAQSGPVNTAQRSELTVTVTTGAGLLEFDRLFTPDTTSGADDRFQVFIDGDSLSGAAHEISGTVGDAAFTRITVPIDAGVHTFTFVYQKLAGGTDGLGTVLLDNIVFPAADGGFIRGDRNLVREQGQFLIEGNIIRDVSQDAINIQAGPRDAGTAFPHPGSPIQFETLNGANQVPGVTIANNVIARFGSDAISFGGDSTGGPQSAVPLGKITHNTIYGGDVENPSNGTVGIRVENNANPTLLNNLIVNTQVGVSVDTSSSGTVLARTYFRGNSSSAVGISNDLPIGDNPTNQLFVDVTNDNFYLAGDSDQFDGIFDGALPIDRALSKIDDRTNFVAVKVDLGIPASNVLSPRLDLFGQVRVDDPLQPPSGVGSEIFSDVGAIERGDFAGPFATLVDPLDNGQDDLDPLNHDVFVIAPDFLTRLVVQLSDNGIGVDDAFVTAPQWELRRNNNVLTEGVDYTFIYNSASNQVIFQSLSVFAPDNRYTITIVDRSAATGIRDLAGNPIGANRPNGDVRFEITLDNGVNDPPVNTIPTSQTTLEDTLLVFSATGGNAITVTDADADLGTNALSVTLVAEHGTAVPTTVLGVTTSLSSVVATPANQVTVGSAASMIGQQVMIGDTQFRFVDSAVVATPGPTDVPLANSDNAATVAGNLAGVLNRDTNFGVGTAVAVGSTVTLSGVAASDPSAVAIVLAGATLSTPDGATVIGDRISVGGTVFTFVDAAIVASPIAEEIAVNVADLDNGVAVATVVALNAFFGPATATAVANVVTLAGVSTEDSLLTLSGDIALLNQALEGLVFLPDSNYFGSASLTIVTEDNGELTLSTVGANGRDQDTIDIQVLPANDLPTLDAIADQLIPEDTVTLNVGISGINGGSQVGTPLPNEIEPVRVTATSSDPSIIPDPTVNYSFFDTTGSLDIAPNADAFGTVTITVTVEDAGLDNVLDDDPGTLLIDESADNLNFVRMFDIVITPGNDAPTLDLIANQSINEDEGPGAVTLTGITAGLGGETESVRLSAVSGNPAIVLDPVITYLSPATTAVLAYDLVADAFGGPTTITVTIEDAGLDNDFATAADNLSFVRTFEIDVNPVNDLPTIDPIANESLAEDGGPKSVALAGITNGALNENEPLVVTAVSSDPSTIPNPTIVYSDPDSTGTLVYDPVSDAFGGPVTITVRVEDGGLDGNLATLGDNGVTLETFDVIITEVNDLPEIDPISNQSIDEDTGPGLVGLSGINNGAANEDDAVRVTATSDDTSIVLDPVVSFASGDSTGTLTYALVPNAFGTVTVTVVVEDAGVDNTLGTADDGVTIETFDIVVNPVNDPPSLSPIPDQVIDEDTGPGMVNLSGIDNGPANETENVRITGLSGDPGIIDNVVITYSSLDPTGSLSYSLVQDAFGGPVTISVTIEDAGLDGIFDDDLGTTLIDESADNLTLVRNFAVFVNPVNDAPTIDAIADLSVAEDTGPHTVAFSGITAGPNETQPVRVTATSSNQVLQLDPVANYVSGDAGGTITFSPVPDRFGTTTISVIVEDGGDDGDLATTADNLTTVETFILTVDPVNDAPALAPIADLVIDEDAAPLSVPLAGIAAGPFESQSLRVTATSDNTALISDPAITYTSPDDFGTLLLVPNLDQFGTATITVTVEDGGDDNDLSTAGDNLTFDQSFLVTVNPVNDVPTITPLPDLAIPEDAPLQTVAFSGVTAGGGESQPIRIVSASSDSSLIPDPVVAYASPDQTGSLTFTPLADQFGAATITVLLEDGGLDGDLSTAADNGTFAETFVVNVSPVNDLPTLDPISDSGAAEDAGPQSLPLSGIFAGGAELDPLRVTAVSSDPTLVGNPVIAYTSPNADATLTYTSLPDQFGTATITVTVEDGGLDGDLSTAADNATFSQTFQLVIDPANDPPTIDDPADVTINEDFPQQTIPLTGITAGPGETEPVRVTATSDVPGLIADPVIVYSSPDTTGDLRFTPLPDQFGVASITLTVEDGGLDGDFNTTADNLFFSQTFTITVFNLPDPPQPMDDNVTTTEDVLLHIEASELLVNDEDPDLGPGSPEVLRVVMPPTSMSLRGATVTFDAATGEVTYDPSTSLELQALTPQQSLQDAFIYSVVDADGELNPPVATVFLNVTGVNDAPSVGDDFATVPHSLEPVVIRPLDNDSDVDGTLDVDSIVITRDPLFGSLAKRVNSSGQVELAYSPFATFSGNDFFRYTISDNLGQSSDQATVTIVPNVTPRTAPDVRGGVAADNFNIDVLTNDVPIQGVLDLSTLTIVTGPSNGQATPQADGTVAYVPDVGFTGTDTFEYTIADSVGNVSIPTSVTIHVVESGLENPFLFGDVNANGDVSSLDALLVINRLARVGNGGSIQVQPGDRGPGFYDVDGSMLITALDALLVINEVGRNANAEDASGEWVTEPIIADIASSVSVVSETTSLDSAFSSVGVSADAEQKLVSVVEADLIDPLVLDLLAEARDSDDSESSSLSLNDLAIVDLL